jgi:hypothetical protein
MTALTPHEALFDALWRLRRGETAEALTAAEIGAETDDFDGTWLPWEDDGAPSPLDLVNQDACAEFAAALRESRTLDALTIAERTLWPTHQSAVAALEAYETAMRASRAGRI